MNNPSFYIRTVIFALVFSTTACNVSPLTVHTPTQIQPTITKQPTKTNTPIPPSVTASPEPTNSPTITLSNTPSQTNTPSETPSLTPTETATATSTKQFGYIPENAIVIYLTHIGTGGPVACGDSLVAVLTGHIRTGDIEKDIQLAVDTLFSIGQYSGWLYNATYPSSLRFGGVSFSKGEAVVDLPGSYVKPKDACDASRYRAQVWTTIQQFPEVTRAIPRHRNSLLGDLLAVYSDSGK
jgi:hypothetical protein